MSQMTVRELVHLLTGYPGDTRVVLSLDSDEDHVVPLIELEEATLIDEDLDSIRWDTIELDEGIDNHTRVVVVLSGQTETDQ